MSDAPNAAPANENGVAQVDETPGFKVFAGNLAYSTTDDGLKTFFAPVADSILSARIILRGTRSAGYGFISVSTMEAAEKAVEALHKKELDGRDVIVEVAKLPEQKEKERAEKRAKRRPGRRGGKAVPGEVTDAEANGEGEKAAPKEGEEAPKKKKTKAKRKPKKKAAATEGEAPATEGATTEGAEAAPKKKTARKPKRAPRPAGEDPVGEPSKNMLFVANLGFNIDDAGLGALFTDAGIPINTARVVRRRWGQPRRSKGYGFVDVGDEEQQKKAIELLQGKEVGGRQIAVKVAVNAEEAKETEAVAEAPIAEAVAVTA